MSLAFLGNITVAPNQKRVVTNTTKKERNPITADLRIFRTGAVYPSAALVERFNLEYQEGNKGNGFDVIDSRKFQNTANAGANFLMIAPVAKDYAKVDLFALCNFENGQPTASVMTQGASTFGKKLLDTIAEVYGTKLEEGQDYIDLVLVKDEALSTMLETATGGIYYTPKVVAAGPRKGEPDYERREKLDIYVLVPESMTKEQPVQQEEEMFSGVTSAEDALIGSNS